MAGALKREVTSVRRAQAKLTPIREEQTCHYCGKTRCSDLEPSDHGHFAQTQTSSTPLASYVNPASAHPAACICAVVTMWHPSQLM
eukprot:4412286-Amphidinium_carterae.1